MQVYDLLDKVLESVNDMETYFFDNEEDVINTLGGILICGEVESSSYLVVTDRHIEEKCDFIVDEYGTYHFGYKIEE